MAIRHAIQRGISSGRFVKEGRYVKLSDKYQARELERSSSKESKSGAQREMYKDKVRLLFNSLSFISTQISK